MIANGIKISGQRRPQAQQQQIAQEPEKKQEAATKKTFWQKLKKMFAA